MVAKLIEIKKEGLKMSSNQVGFSYGVLYDTLEKQANEQGYTLGDKAEIFEEVRNSINVCMFHVATDSQVSAMTKKLHGKVVKALKLEAKEQ